MTQIKSPTIERFISERVHTIQFKDEFVNGKPAHPQDWQSTVDDYCKRTETTRNKIGKVWIPFQVGQAYNPGVEEILQLLYNAIGVYSIPDIMDGRSHLWHKITGDDINPIHGDYWPSYLGEKEICSYGGRVVVVLSDEGVKWLNEIADTVKAYIPVDVPTTKPTKEKCEGEILDEEVNKLIEQFNTYLYEDDTDWSIGTKLIQQFWDPKSNLKIVQSLREGSL